MAFLFNILLAAQVLISISMGGLILIQRSEGGALGMGGGPSGFMSARGAGNLLTRATAILALLFFANSIGMTIVGNFQQHGASAVDQVDTSKLVVSSSTMSASAASAAAANTSSSAPSLSDLPLNAPSQAPVQTQGGSPLSALPSAGPVTTHMPAPLSSSSVSVPAAKLPAPLAKPATAPKATGGVFPGSASSSVSLPAASKSSSASLPASSTGPAPSSSLTASPGTH